MSEDIGGYFTVIVAMTKIGDRFAIVWGLSSNGTKNRVKTKLIISNLFRVIISCDLVTQNLTFASSASESRKPISDLAVTDVRFMLYQAASEGRSLFRSLVRKRALSHSRVVKISSRQWL